MAKLNTLFDTFLSNIEPDSKAVEYAQMAHEPVREYLENDEKFSQYVEGSFLYGSYKRHTAVGDIKDVDVVILTNFDVTDPDNTPNKVLRKLKEALARYYKDPENPEYQRRSIRINEPLPGQDDITMTLDIIPAVAEGGEDEPLLVPDREVQCWIQSHPKGHLKRTTDLNKKGYSKERFVPLVKMMKWWWKYQCEANQPEVERPKPKGFWVECLTAENFDPTQENWGDHFITTLEHISGKYSSPTCVPKLLDPGLPGEVIRTTMELGEFQVFMDTVNTSLATARKALNEVDELVSSQLWQQVFGGQFPIYDAEETNESRVAAKAVVLQGYSHAEPLRWPDRSAGKFRVGIDAYVYRADKRLGGLNSNGRILSSDFKIKYVANTNVRGNYEAWWRVVNTGAHAARDNGLRGGFFLAKLSGGAKSGNPLVNWEYTRYTGKHWIECFIVKDGTCIARSQKFYVNIKSPEWPR